MKIYVGHLGTEVQRIEFRGLRGEQSASIELVDQGAQLYPHEEDRWVWFVVDSKSSYVKCPLTVQKGSAFLADLLMTYSRRSVLVRLFGRQELDAAQLVYPPGRHPSFRLEPSGPWSLGDN